MIGLSVALIETLTLSLGAAFSKALVKLWLGEPFKLADAGADGLIDAIKSHIEDFETRRSTYRLIEEIQDVVASKLENVIVSEFRNIPRNEVDAAVIATTDVFRTIESADFLVRNDLQAARLLHELQPHAATNFALLSEDSRKVAQMLLNEGCEYAVSIAAKLPDFHVAASRELLKRTTEMMNEIHRSIEQTGAIRTNSPVGTANQTRHFDIDYRRAVIQKLDRLQLFGVRSAGAGAREWSLSVAYVSLASRNSTESEVNDILYSLNCSKRLLICGEAGAGKTTLLHWLAVRAANKDFEGAIAEWNGLIPLYVRFRDYAKEDRELPRPEQFLERTFPMLVAPMPAQWVHEALRTGALVLVDGIDEFPAARRREITQWLIDIENMGWGTRIIVCSRPAAVEVDGGNGALVDRFQVRGYEVLSIQPMASNQVDALISQWHESVGRDIARDSEKDRLSAYAAMLKHTVRDRASIRSLATNPLLCAMICALNWDRRQQLPDDRMTLYRLALEMLIDSRDSERNVGPATLQGLGKDAKEELIDGVAYWMLRNGYSDAPVEEVVQQISDPLKRYPVFTHDAFEVLTELLERSGVLRQPSTGIVDFIHRTFMEFMAARAAVQMSDIGALVERAREESWRETIIFAAGHAKGLARDKLVENLLTPDDDTAVPIEAQVTAACCLETAGASLRPDLLQRLRLHAKTLFPPTDSASAMLLAPAAAHDPSLLKGYSSAGPNVVAACIRCAAAVGGEPMLQVIESYASHDSSVVRQELLNAWSGFDNADYIERVIKTQRWLVLSQGTAPEQFRGDGLLLLKALAFTQEIQPELYPVILEGFLKAGVVSVMHLSSELARKLKAIRSLRGVSATSLESESLAILSSASNVKYLSLPLKFHHQATISLIAQFAQLRKLELSGSSQGLGVAPDFRDLAKCLSLQALIIKRVRGVTALLPEIKYLEYLELDRAPAKNLHKIILPSLRHIRLVVDMDLQELDLSRFHELVVIEIIVEIDKDLEVHLPGNVQWLEFRSSHSVKFRSSTKLQSLKVIINNGPLADLQYAAADLNGVGFQFQELFGFGLFSSSEVEILEGEVNRDAIIEMCRGRNVALAALQALQREFLAR